MNYAGEGPDLTSRIEDLSEQIYEEIGSMDHDEMREEYDLPKEFDKDLDEEEVATFLATERLSGGKPKTLDVYVRLDNPAYIGGKTNTWIDIIDNEKYREDATDEILDENDATKEDIEEYEDDIQERIYEMAMYDESKLLTALTDALNKFETDANPADIYAGLDIQDSEVSASELERVLKESEDLEYAEDYDATAESGRLIQSHIIGQVFKNLGYDGIVLQNANDRFNSMDMGTNTSHIHVFEETPASIKSATDNSGAYSKDNPDIYFSREKKFKAVDTNSPNFKKWFGDSEITTAKGKPLEVYHGTSNSDFNIFATKDNYGTFFTSSPKTASSYAYNNKKDRVYPAYLKMINPLYIDAQGQRWDEIPMDETIGDLIEADADGTINTDDLVSAARDGGFDGLVVSNVNDDADEQGKPSDVYVVLNKTQIKSSRTNTGDFDPENPDIRFSRNETLKDIEVMSGTENLNAEMDGETSSSSLSHGEKVINEIYRKLTAVSSPALAKSKFGKNQLLKSIEDYRAARKVIQSPLKSAAEKQKFAAKIVQKLPPVPRSKLIQKLSSISRVTNPDVQQKKLEEYLKMADKVLTEYLRKEIVGKVDKAVSPTKTQKKAGGKVKEGRGAEFEKDLDYIRGTALGIGDEVGVEAGLRNEQGRLFSEKMDLKEELSDARTDKERKRLEQAIDDIESKENLLAVFGAIEAQSFDELVRSWTALSVFMTEGRLPWRVQQEIWRERNKENRTKYIEDTTGEIEPEDETVADETQRIEREKSVSGKFKEAMSATSNMIQSWELMLDKTARKAGGGTLDSWSVKHFGSIAHKATRDYERMMLDTNEEVMNQGMEIFGAKNNAELASKFSALDKVQADAVNTYHGKDGRPMAISPLQAAYWYQISKDGTNPVVQATFERMGVTEQTLKEIEKMMGPELKAWADYLVDTFYQDFHGDTNEVHKQMYGIDLEKTLNYVPWHRKVFGKAADKEMDGFLAGLEAGSIKKGGLRTRVVNTKPFRVKNINDVLVSHIADMSHFKAWAIPTKEINGTFNSPQVQAFIRQHHGASTAKTMRRFQDRFVRSDKEIIDDLQFLDGVRSNITKAMIGMNPVVFLKQLSSIPAYMSDIPAVDWFKYTGEAFANPRKAARILGRSTMMKSRYKRGFERDVATAMKKGGSDVVAQKKRFGDHTMLLTQLGDKVAITMGGYAVYKHHLERLKKEGVPHKKAHDQAIMEFEKSTERAQQSGHNKDIGWFQGGTPVMKLFTMFMTSPASYSRQIFTAVRNMKTNPKDSSKRLFIYAVVMPVMFQAIADALMAFDGDEDDRERMLGHQFKALAMGPMNGLPVIRTMMEGYLQAISGGTMYRGQFTPAMEGFETSRRAISDFVKYLDDGTDMIGPDEYLERSLIGLMHTVGYGTGIPTKPLQRIGTGIKDAITGETEHPFRRSIGYSKYAVGE